MTTPDESMTGMFTIAVVPLGDGGWSAVVEVATDNGVIMAAGPIRLTEAEAIADGEEVSARWDALVASDPEIHSVRMPL